LYASVSVPRIVAFCLLFSESVGILSFFQGNEQIFLLHLLVDCFLLGIVSDHNILSPEMNCSLTDTLAGRKIRTLIGKAMRDGRL
jgi:hypothetical protein